MTKKKLHVVPHSEGWAVKGAGNQRATAIHSIQQSAIAQARDIARNQGSEMLIHGTNGRIRERNTYGKDPYPPEG